MREQWERVHGGPKEVWINMSELRAKRVNYESGQFAGKNYAHKLFWFT